MRAPFPNVRILNLAAEKPGTANLVGSLESYLARFQWSRRTGNTWIGESIPGVLGLFLVELDPLSELIDRYVWVIVGDIPPANISSECAKSPKQALEGYIAEMRAWVEAVEKGEPTDELIPVDGDPTPANAAALKSRLDFLAKRIQPLLP